MVKIPNVLLVFSIGVMHAHAGTLVRKHQFDSAIQGIMEVDTYGNIEISDSARNLLPSLVRGTKQQKTVEIDANGNVEISDLIADSTRKLSPSLVRGTKQQKSVEIDADGNVAISDRVADLTHKLAPSIVRGTKPQNIDETEAKGNGEISDRMSGSARKLSPSLVRGTKQQNINKVDAASNVEISDLMTDSTRKLLPSLARGTKQQNTDDFDASSNVEISDFEVDSTRRVSPSLVRGTKQQNIDDVDGGGNAEISELMADSTRKPSLSLVRGTKQQNIDEVDTSGNGESSDLMAESTRKLLPSLVRATKQQYIEEVDAGGNAEIYDLLAGSARKLSPGLATSMKQQNIDYDDAGGSSEISDAMTDFARKLSPSFVRGTKELSVQEVENFRNGDQSRKVGALICFFSMMGGSLLMAVIVRSNRKDPVALAADSKSGCRNCDGPDTSAASDSDGESLSSSEEHPTQYDIQTTLPSQMVIRTGLLWKLERRFNESLTSHNGSNFEPTDRFAYLESWDLRFFSLDVDEGAVLFTYVSELNEFRSVVFEIKSIESEIIQVPSLKAQMARAKKSSRGALIGLYDGYLLRLQQLGYNPPENDTSDPESLSVFVVSGTRQGENDGTRSVGRLKWHTGEAADATREDRLSQMCLGSANCKDCKRWHAEISDILERVQPKDIGRKRSSDLAVRVEQAALEAMAASAMCNTITNESSSSFQGDASTFCAPSRSATEESAAPIQ